MKMDTIQVAACQPKIFIKNISHLHHLPSKPYALPIKFNPLSQTSLSLRVKNKPNFQCVPISKSRQPFQVCFAGGSGMMANDNEDYPGKALKEAMKKSKAQSIEDLLRQQIEKGEYYDSGGSGGRKPPRGGGGGGGFGGFWDKSFGGMSDEILQVVLAAIGFLVLYISFINGEELMKLGLDFIKYLLSGKQSVRLKRVMYKGGRLYRGMIERVVDMHWLEKAILKRKYLESKSDE